MSVERTMKIRSVSAHLDTYAIELAEKAGLTTMELAEALALSTQLVIHRANVEHRKEAKENKP